MLDALAAQDDIAMARDRLARAQAAALAPPAPGALERCGRGRPRRRLPVPPHRAGGGAERRIRRAGIQPDLSRPTLPRLSASLRGTAEGLHGLLDALETGIPLVVLEEAEISVERPADPEIGRATVLRLTLTARGVLPPARPPKQSREQDHAVTERAVRRTVPHLRATLAATGRGPRIACGLAPS